MADILYCVAGGTPTECGFLADIDPADLESCMRSNYFTAAYSASSMFKMWTEDDRLKEKESVSNKLRQIVFINSAGAFLGLPGYTAYTRKSANYLTFMVKWYKIHKY
jgi:3-dehydrosphinganine reductase